MYFGLDLVHDLGLHSIELFSLLLGTGDLRYRWLLLETIFDLQGYSRWDFLMVFLGQPPLMVDLLFLVL